MEAGASSTRPSWGRRLVGIEGLRGLAAVAVVVAHVQGHLEAGVELGRAERVVGQLHHGLTLFFALSGFLLFRPFAASLVAGAPRPPIRRFLRNRALRIYPAYVVVFLLASYVLQTTYQHSTSTDGIAAVRGTLGPITDPLTALADVSMLHTLLPGTVKTGLGVSWSLTTELTYYLALPLLAVAAVSLARRGASRRLVVWLVPAALLATGLTGKLLAEATLHYRTPGERFHQLWGATWHAVLERSLLAQADLFAYGAAAAIVFVLAEQGVLGPRAIAAVRGAAGAVVLLVVLQLLRVGHLPGALGTSRWEDSPIAATCACLILVAALPTARRRASAPGRVLELPPVRYAGLISYSLYLWHLPVLWWLETHGATFGVSPAGFAGNAVLVLAVTAALASLTYHLVEAPALRRKRRTDVAPAPRPAEPRSEPAERPLTAV
jgi:peptidoglycan/LPS O-acetylase OafA/YrhL